MMSCGRTPASLREATTLRITSGLEMAPTALGLRPDSPGLARRPTGLTLTPTTSPGSKKLRQASAGWSAPVNSVMPRSIIEATAWPSIVWSGRTGVVDLDDAAGEAPGHGVVRALDLGGTPGEGGRVAPEAQPGARDEPG